MASDQRYQCERWGVLWQHARPDGEPLGLQGGLGALFRSRREARAYIAKNFGYIAKRADLRVAPHWWRMPKAVRVRVTVEVQRGE